MSDTTVADRLANTGCVNHSGYIEVVELERNITTLTAELARVKAEKQELMERLVQNTEALAQYRQVKAERDALIMAVGNKYPNETRFETALRYIRQAENQPMCAAADAAIDAAIAVALEGK